MKTIHMAVSLRATNMKCGFMTSMIMAFKTWRLIVLCLIIDSPCFATELADKPQMG
jgi:tRNA(Phe) wybutosine-synthesizing methylase Tyw3